MQTQLNLNRDLLYYRHRLSHQQIDDFTGKSEKMCGLEEKLCEMARVAEFLTITDTLTSAGLNFIPFKGPLLSFRIYSDPTIRYSKDFDLFIGLHEIKNAVTVLAKIGYEPVYYEWPDNEETIQFKGKLRNQYHLYNNDKEISIELHWKLFSYPPVNQDKIDALMKNNLSVLGFADRKFTVMNPNLDLIYLIIHGGLHAWRRLKWLVDVHEFIKKGLIDETIFCNLVHEMKAERMVSLCNEMLAFFYPGQPILPLFKPCPRYLAKHSFSMIQKETDKEFESFTGIIRYFLFVMFAFPGLKYKVNTFGMVLDSLKDEGSQKKSTSSLLFSLLRPQFFLKKRYHLEKENSQ